MNFIKIRAVDFCKSITDGTHDSPKRTKTGKPLVTSKHLSRYGIDFDSTYLISESDYKKVIARSRVDKWDVLYSMIGTIGNIYIETSNNTEYACKNVGIFKMGGAEYKSKWLYYYLQTRAAQEYILGVSRGTTQGYVPLGALRELQIPITDSYTMNRITSVLWEIDEKIKNNRAINHNLQQQAQALYKAQFPYSVEDKLPPGWKLGKVRDIIELHDSKRIPLSSRERDKMTERRYPYYGATSVMDYVSDYIFDGCYLLLAEDGTVIDSNGHPVLQYVWGKFWVNNHTHIITGKNGFNVESLLLYFSQLSVQSIVTGAVQPKISQANLCSVPVIIPPREVVEEFNSTISSFFTMIRGLSDENNRLAQLRDSLLPKLMSGEIDVSNIKL